MWSSYMYMALQMYVIGNVTVVVWHLYLFGYVLVVYVCDKCGKFKKVLHVLTENVAYSKSLWCHVVISYGCYVNVSHAWPSGLVHTCRFYPASLYES